VPSILPDSPRLHTDRPESCWKINPNYCSFGAVPNRYIQQNVVVEPCVLDVTHGLGQAPTSLALSDRAEVYTQQLLAPFIWWKLVQRMHAYLVTRADPTRRPVSNVRISLLRPPTKALDICRVSETFWTWMSLVSIDRWIFFSQPHAVNEALG
jgi:hypothetical protein